MKTYESQISWNQQENTHDSADTAGKMETEQQDSAFALSMLSFTVLDGRLVDKPSLIQTKNGKLVSHFSLAMNHSSDSVTFLDIEAWEKRAKACYDNLDRGSRVIVHGNLRQDKWEDQQGQKRSKIKLVASNVIFIPKRPGNNKND